MQLTEIQSKAISSLAISPLAKKFYWTGGTLLAIRYLQHRRSLDLDFFTDERFSFTEVNGWVQKFKKQAGFQKVSYQKIFDRYEILFENEEELRIEFVYYDQGRKTLKKRKQFLGLKIDSLEDIAANKIMAHFDRNEPKDLFDIYFLLTKKTFKLEELLNLAQQKFGVEFSEDLFFSEAFKSLSLLGELKPLMLQKDEIEKERLLKEIAAYFQEESNRYLKKLLR